MQCVVVARVDYWLWRPPTTIFHITDCRCPPLPFEVLLSFVSSWHWPICGRCQGVLAVAMLGSTSVLKAYGLKPDRYGGSIELRFRQMKISRSNGGRRPSFMLSFMLSTPATFQKGRYRAWRRTMANDVGHRGRIL